MMKAVKWIWRGGEGRWMPSRFKVTAHRKDFVGNFPRQHAADSRSDEMKLPILMTARGRINVHTAQTLL